MTSLSQADVSAIVIIAIIVFYQARRTYALYQGTTYSTIRIFAFGTFTTIFFAFFAVETLYVAVSTWGSIALALIVPYAAIVVGFAFAIEPVVHRLVKFEDLGDGQVFYRLPIVVPLMTTVLFVIRVAVQIWVLGIASIATFTIPTSLPVDALVILIVFDLVYGISVGLLYGRGFGVRRAFLERGKVSPALPSQ